MNCKNIASLIFFFISLALGQTDFPNTKIEYVVSGDTLTQPYYRNISLDSTSDHIKYAVIHIHGGSDDILDDAYYQYNWLLSAMVGIEAEDSTILVAPIYPRYDDIDQYNLGNDVLYWNSIDWNAGDLSRDTQTFPRPFRLSSFSTIDSIYHRLIENHSSLERIVLSGHSSGSQMVVRYAAGGRAQNNLSNLGIEFYYVPMNTPSFLYYDEYRVVDQSADVFNFGPTNCTSANQYKYGLDNLNQYMEETGDSTIIDNFKTINMTYLIGEYDFGGQTSTCARMVQGNSRVLRTHIYFAYINYFYGETVFNTHLMAEVPGAEHNYGQMISSNCGMSAVFFEGECNTYINGTQLFNHQPVARAGEDEIVNPGSTVVLDGSNSYDTDGQITSFQWQQISGEGVSILYPDSAMAQFIMPSGGFVDIKLTVVDNEGKPGIDTVSYAVNQLPTAHAGADMEVGHSVVVILDGSGSVDADGSISTYLWEQVGGYPINIFSGDQQVATFYSPATNSQLSFTLTVFDEQGLMDKDTVNVFVSFLSAYKTRLNDEGGISLTPNPFNSSMSINFIKHTDFKIKEISIYDVTGKKIQNWFVNNSSGGHSHISWNGKDGRGFEIRSGLYFVRFEGKKKSITKKVTYLK